MKLVAFTVLLVLLHDLLSCAAAKGGLRSLQQASELFLYDENGLNASCLQYSNQVSEGGVSYISAATTVWYTAALISNKATCQSDSIGELRDWAALSFEFRGAQLNPTCPIKLSLGRCCNYNCPVTKEFTSNVYDMRNLTISGSIPDQWETITISTASLMDNAAQNCDNRIWDLSRLHYNLYMRICPSCNPGPQNVCHIRKIKVLRTLPAPVNKAPRVDIPSSVQSLVASAGSILYFPASVLDDQLPSASAVTSTWKVVQGPQGYQPSHITFADPSLPSTHVSVSPSAPIGRYVLSLAATDTLLTTTATVGFNVTSSTFLAITSPLPSSPSQPLRVQPGAVLALQAALNAGSLAGAPYTLQWTSSAGSVAVTPSPTSPLAASAAVPSDDDTLDNFTLIVTLKAGPFTRSATLAVAVLRTLATKVTPTWQPGTRIPTAFIAASTCAPRLHDTANWEVVASGAWSNIFATSALQDGDCVTIPVGVSVVYDVCAPTLRLRCVVVLGSLSFPSASSTCLRVGTLQLWPGAKLTIPPPFSASTVDIVFDGGLDAAEDPSFQTLGLVAYNAIVNISGGPRCGARLRGSGMVAGSSSIVVPGASGCWVVGDTLVLSDTQRGLNVAHWSFSYNPTTQGQTEYVTVASVEGSTVRLTTALKYSHMDSWVGMLTRSVRIRSASPAVPRAHMMVAGEGSLTLKWAEVVDMGRQGVQMMNNTVLASDCSVVSVGTNQMGRYPVHMHRTRSPSLVQGVAVYPSGLTLDQLLPRHGIVQHDTHAELLGNVVVGARGSGIFLEEVFNSGLVKDNFVVGCGGGTGGNDDGRFDIGALGGQDMGFAGSGLWMRSTVSKIESNVVQGYFPSAGYSFFVHNNYVTGTFANISGRPADLVGKTYAALTGSGNPMQRFGGFIDNEAMGIFPIDLEIAYATAPAPIGNLVVNFRSVHLGSSGRGLSIIHGVRVTLQNCSFIVDVPPSTTVTAVGVYKNNGVGSSMNLVGGVFSGWATAAGVFPLGTNITGTKMIGNNMDIRFRYQKECPACTPEGNGMSYVTAATGSVYRLFNGTASIPAGLQAVPLPIKTDGVAVLV